MVERVRVKGDGVRMSEVVRVRLKRVRMKGDGIRMRE